jgi:hypothetical protein
MSKIYSVNIKGRTLESRDLKVLLSRAVAQKRKLDRQFIIKNLSRGQSAMESASNLYFSDNQAASL